MGFLSKKELTDEEIMTVYREKGSYMLSTEEYARFEILDAAENAPAIKAAKDKKVVENSKLTERDILLKILDRLDNLVSMGETERDYKYKQRADNRGQEDGKYY